MHPLFAQASGLTHNVIDAAIEQHKDKGLGRARLLPSLMP
jgi:hypothetical protein